MVIDYSQTINRFTYLDAYPLPKIDCLIEKISHYGVFSTLDLESAYHQIPIDEEERRFTAFEACNRLFQFCRIPFGVTNGVACFQRAIDEIIHLEKLEGTFAYVDNITVCGRDQLEHDENLQKFYSAVEKYHLTLNQRKSIISAKSVRLLGYEVSKGVIKPDPERFRALLELPPPMNLKTQQRIVGMFAYYSQWIPRFSDKIHPLVHNVIFPLPSEVESAYVNMKTELVHAAMVSIDRTLPLVIETDASDIAISATLNQQNRPVAFFSRTLSAAERTHSSVEKEAYSIVEATRKWRHYLLGTHFKLITDQRSVSFMYDNKHVGKIKNDKIQRWRIELSQYSYDVVYRPGSQNKAADALSRAFCSVTSSDSDLKRIHETLCHPGVTRLLHFIRAKNLPYSLSDVKAVVQQCRPCAELKPRFYEPTNNPLIKATHPFERLSIDFKGPVPSKSRNRYILTIIDEYTRFPFAYACSDMTARTIISHLIELFSIFGFPSFVHSDRGPSFMSDELKTFLHTRGVATSRTTSYNPQCNGQVERLNNTLWKSISLCLRSKNLEISDWETVLPETLHSIRSLLNTATNATPHERMFSFNRRSPVGTTLPNWLMQPGPVLLKRSVRTSKYEPLVEEVELLECNPEYAYIRLSDGQERTVSLRQLAPVAEVPNDVATRNIDCDTQLGTSSAHLFTDISHLEDSVPHSHTRDSSGNSDNVNSSNDNLTHLIQQQQRTRPYVLRNREA
jgi:transposase InsO family protein